MGFFNKLKEDLKEVKEQKKAEDEKTKISEKEKTNEQANNLAETINEKTLLKVKAKYQGGHPDLPESSDGKITINKLGLYFGGTLRIDFKIPIEDIAKVEYKTEDQLRTDAALARYELFGIFSAGMNSKRSFLLLTYDESGLENKIIFESKDAPGIVAAVMKVRQEYVKTAPKEAPISEIQVDIPVQIKKLAELRDSGILTDTEFESKKKELLAKM